MLPIPPALQARLDSGVTTLCRCWLITRNDGATQGFTDHDEDVVVNGVTCRAASGLTASEASEQLGLAITGSELSGALNDDTLTEDDLAAGRYDAATVEIWLVDWSEPDLAVRLGAGVLGEVRREGAAFTAEVRGLAHRFAEDNGRLFTATCNADLGDAKCKVDLTSATMRGEGIVAAPVATSSFTASGLDAYADGWFTQGRLAFTGGPNTGVAVEVKSHSAGAGIVTLELWQAMPQPIGAGDTFTVTAGCDKHFDTCVGKFANAANFRGFPHIPGNDFLVSYPVAGESGHDGGSLQSF
ncbi:MAG: Gene Transfer Agent FAD/FMN-containing dehydrogenase [Pseudolabrys sp.]|jgi:uncharacterized phage protein (TIGR02218 family)|nr:Gene Transfer Agent FAD/FMN-containing dehydrogenase [Pseudolabrys sp.]